MPELPEIEAIRHHCQDRATGRRISGLDIHDDSALHGLSKKTLRKIAIGGKFSEITRHGKLLFLRLGKGRLLVVHFGMTGDLLVVESDSDLPKHVRVVFTFDDEARLAFDNPRKLGHIDRTDEIETYLDENRIGPDALSLSRKAFGEIIGGARGQVKPALMDQSKLAGIGNIYSDEILFRARLRPDAKRADLSDAQLKTLHGAMRGVLRTASNKRSEGRTLPKNWLARHREEGACCPRCDGELSHAKIGGRTAWFCPSCQGGADG